MLLTPSPRVSIVTPVLGIETWCSDEVFGPKAHKPVSGRAEIPTQVRLPPEPTFPLCWGMKARARESGATVLQELGVAAKQS